MDAPRENYNIINFILQELNNEFHNINNVLNEEFNVNINRDINTNAPCRASKEFIDSLQEIEITEEGKTCYICLEDFEIGEKCVELPCKDHKHLFHNEKENCDGIKKWLEKSNTCPVCRSEFPLETTTVRETAENEETEERGDLPENIVNRNNIFRNIITLPNIINHNPDEMYTINRTRDSNIIHILNNNIRILSPQEIIEMEEQRQLEAAIQASLEEQ